MSRDVYDTDTRVWLLRALWARKNACGKLAKKSKKSTQKLLT